MLAKEQYGIARPHPEIPQTNGRTTHHTDSCRKPPLPSIRGRLHSSGNNNLLCVAHLDAPRTFWTWLRRPMNEVTVPTRPIVPSSSEW
jgi:hypothetical protein